MQLIQVLIFITYYFGIFLIVFLSYKKKQSSIDFIIGDRKLNFWLTALSAHASDMSAWLFLAYPAQIFLFGSFNAWAGIGLTAFMLINWQFIAPKIRIVTEQLNSLTLNAYFENRFADKTHFLRIVAGIMTLIFFTIYICSGLVSMGYLVESLFSLSYFTGISIGLFLVMLYVFLGGYTTIAWIDLFQGFFLLLVIVFIPIVLLVKIGGFSEIISIAQMRNLNLSLLPDFSTKTLYNALILSAGWGLGYLGQPHIITKFMGIKNVSEIKKAKYLGISWQALALGGATLMGLIGIALFPTGIDNPELIILETVKKTLHPFFASLVLCAIIAATTNVMAAQILVVASSVTEDFYKKFIRKNANSKELLRSSRISVILVCLIAFFIAYFKISTIYNLVLFAWTGLGTSFGPLILISLYSKKINRFGAIVGIFSGGLTTILSPYVSKSLNFEIPTMLVGFLVSSFFIFLVSSLTKKTINERINLDN
jgi:solute:Na+ symporter, SSS family